MLVAVIGIPSIIATLGTQFFWGGITTGISGGTFPTRCAPSTIIRSPAVRVWRGAGASRRSSSVVLAATVLIWMILNRHLFGEHLLFIGDNNNVARVLGIQVGVEKIKLFTLMGLLGALAGILLSAREQELLQHAGPGLPADGAGRRVHRRHLDLRRSGQRSSAPLPAPSSS